MKRFMRFYDKHKGGFIIALSLLVVAVIVYGIYQIATNKKIDKIDDSFYKADTVLAKYIITGRESGEVGLVEVNGGKEINCVDLRGGRDTRYIYSKSRDMDKLYVYGTTEKTFYEVTEQNDSLVKKDLYSMTNEKVSVGEFKISSDSIVILSEDRKTLYRISIPNKSLTHSSVDNAITDWVLLDNKIVYSMGTNIGSMDLKDGKASVIDVGEESSGVFYSGNEILVLNRFGQGKNSSILMKINPENLYIKNIYKFDNSKIHAITSPDDKAFYFIDEVMNGDKGTQILSAINIEKFAKEKVSINTKKFSQDFRYDKNNTLLLKGYLYTDTGEMIEILDLGNKTVSHKINVDTEVFMPVLNK